MAVSRCEIDVLALKEVPPSGSTSLKSGGEEEEEEELTSSPSLFRPSNPSSCKLAEDEMGEIDVSRVPGVRGGEGAREGPLLLLLLLLPLLITGEPARERTKTGDVRNL